jgi:hypothetical protein
MGNDDWGEAVTVTYSAPSPAPRKKTRSALLPLLVILFLISYSILTWLVVEQGRTIDSQRVLLREMLKDSNELAQLKVKLAQDAAAKQAQPPAHSEKKEQRKQTDPDVSKPSARRSTNKESKNSEEPTRSLKSFPEKPASDLEDVRRSTRTL